MKLKSNEFELIGNWIYQENEVIEDETAKRVHNLKENYLIKIATDISGWEVLYQDPNDKRYWELTYLHSEYHGGGAPSLININVQLAKKKYGINI